MADGQTSLRRRGAVMRIAGGTMALLFAMIGVILGLVAIAIGALNIAPIRIALLETGLRQFDTGDTVIRIDDIGGEWPRRLTLEGVSIADGDGEWLALTRAVLEWNPNALWRGDVRVTTLETEGLSLARLPGGDEAAADTGGGFSLPSLPVDIHLDHFSFRDTQISRPVIGEEITLDAEGDAIYASGRMKLTLDAARSDGKLGEVKAALDYLTGPQRGTLAIDLRDGTPGQRGIAARLLALDGLTALTLSAKGEMRDGLMTGALSLDGGRALRASATLHGGCRRHHCSGAACLCG
jgi:translocation and assembly module TamB